MKRKRMNPKHPDATRIYDFAWNCTIGAGRVGEDFPDEPDSDVLEALSRILRRKLTGDDINELVDAWQRLNMEQAFP